MKRWIKRVLFGLLALVLLLGIMGFVGSRVYVSAFDASVDKI
jgi:hypothetical protein